MTKKVILSNAQIKMLEEGKRVGGVLLLAVRDRTKVARCDKLTALGLMIRETPSRSPNAGLTQWVYKTASAQSSDSK